MTDKEAMQEEWEEGVEEEREGIEAESRAQETASTEDAPDADLGEGAEPAGAVEEEADEPPGDTDEAAADVSPEPGAEEPEEPGYSYDQMPYTSHPFFQSHPDRLAVNARLFGLSPAPVDESSVLELGCGRGGNLIPMALQMPGSRFVGVDLSRKQIEEAQRVAEELGLENVRFEHGSIDDVDDSWGQFDYIVCHGVYSWVPADVRERIMEISAANLAPDGIAYISYNTYPGWHMREMIRHMMRYHAGQFDKAEMRVGQSRALLKFLTDALPKEGGPYARYLRQELNMLNRQEDTYIYHEHLEEVNEPVYFHQFIEQAADKSLQYLGESEIGAMLLHGVSSPQIRQTILRISPDVIRMEQYMDFLRNRTFRQTLLCHQDREIDRRVEPEAVESFLVWSNAQSLNPQIDYNPRKVSSFRNVRGNTARVRRPVTKAALQVLAQRHPAAVAFGELFEAVLELLPERWKAAEPEQMRRALAEDIRQLYAIGLLELRTWQPEMAVEVSDRPKISPLAAVQIREKQPRVVNMLHRLVPVGPVARLIAPLLDGEHDRDALIDHAKGLVRDGELPLRHNGMVVVNPDEAESTIAQVLDQALRNLAASALLVA